MADMNRRDFLKATAGVAASAATAGWTAGDALAQAKAPALTLKPEKGATLRVLRWKRFVQGDEDMWMKNTERFTQVTGIKVRVDNEGWEDVRPKAAVAANVASVDSTAIASADQDAEITQILNGTATATADQDSSIDQGSPKP